MDLTNAKKNCKDKSISIDEIIVPNVGVYDRNAIQALMQKENEVLKEVVHPQQEKSGESGQAQRNE